MEKGEGIMLFGIWISKHGDQQQPPSTEDNIASVKVDHQPPNNQEAPSRRIIKRPRLRQPNHQELPGAYRDFIALKGAVEGSLRLVICKTLTNTDTKEHQARLAMPCGQIKHDFLTADEEVSIRQKRLDEKRKRCHGILVKVVDPSQHERDITLARWNWNDDNDKGGSSEENKKNKCNSWWYALLGKQWKELVRVNGLAEGDAIQVWSFRFQAEDRLKLGFVIHKVQPPSPTPASTNSNNTNHGSARCKRTRRG